MENLKVYLDTSVISHLLQEDVPEKMADTRKLWEKFKAGQYDVYLSTVTLEEISDCKEPKKSQMYQYLKQINYTPIQITDSMSSVAQQIIDMGILTKKSRPKPSGPGRKTFSGRWGWRGPRTGSRSMFPAGRPSGRPSPGR